MSLKRKDTPENRAFWAHVEETARQARSVRRFHFPCEGRAACMYGNGQESCSEVSQMVEPWTCRCGQKYTYQNLCELCGATRWWQNAQPEVVTAWLRYVSPEYAGALIKRIAELERQLAEARAELQAREEPRGISAVDPTVATERTEGPTRDEV